MFFDDYWTIPGLGNNDNNNITEQQVKDLIEERVQPIENTTITHSSDISQLTSVTTHHATDIASHTTDITSLKTVTSNHTTDIATLKTTTDKHTNDVRVLGDITDEQSADILQHQQTLEQHTEHINWCIANINTHATTLEEIWNNISIIAGNITWCVNNINYLYPEVQKLKSAVEILQKPRDYVSIYTPDDVYWFLNDATFEGKILLVDEPVITGNATDAILRIDLKKAVLPFVTGTSVATVSESKAIEFVIINKLKTRNVVIANSSEEDVVNGVTTTWKLLYDRNRLEPNVGYCVMKLLTHDVEISGSTKTIHTAIWGNITT